MPDELMISAVLARHVDFKALRKRIRQESPLTAEELSEIANLPPDLLVENDGPVGLSRPLEPFIPIILTNLVEAKEAIDEKASTLPWIGNPTSDFQYAGLPAALRARFAVLDTRVPRS